MNLRRKRLLFPFKRRRFNGTPEHALRVLRQWLNTMLSRLLSDKRKRTQEE